MNKMDCRGVQWYAVVSGHAVVILTTTAYLKLLHGRGIQNHVQRVLRFDDFLCQNGAVQERG